MFVMKCLRLSVSLCVCICVCVCVCECVIIKHEYNHVRFNDVGTIAGLIHSDFQSILPFRLYGIIKH